MKFFYAPKRLNFTILSFLFFGVTLIAQVGINTTSPDAGAILDVDSSTKGLLIPRIDIPDLGLIAPITGGSTQSLLVYNIGTTTTPGFYYWDVASTTWIPLTTLEDDDFYKVGTSTPAQAITDNIWRTGKVAIGKTSASSALDITDNTSANATNIQSTGSSNVLNVKRSGSKSGTARGVYVDYANGDSGSSEQIAFGSYMRSGSGTGRRYGLYNNVNATVGNSRQLVGVYNKIRDGNGSKWGIWNNMATTENGDIIGVYTQTDNGGGHHQGLKNSLAGTGNSANTGTGNYISNSGSGAHTGVSNLISGAGTGTKIGVQNQISNGTGTNYGIYNDINNTTAGQSSYGTWNEINTGNGTNYAGWFDSFGTGGTHYAAVFNRGDVVANESGLDNDFRVEGNTDQNLLFVDASTDRVGIGTSSPGYTLDVSGNIHFSGAIYNSGALQHPDYVFETYFDGFSEYNKEYSRMNLEQIELYLRENKHLPNIQSRKDVLENGWNVSEGVRDNLEKVEELFLHNIEASKKIKKLENENKILSDKLDSTIDLLNALNQKLNSLDNKIKS